MGFEVNTKDLFEQMEYMMYSKSKGSGSKAQSVSIINFTLESDFFEQEFRKFKDDKLTDKISTISSKKNIINQWHRLKNAEDSLGPYNNDTRYTYHRNFINELASQWKTGQMVSSLEWRGMDLNDFDGTGYVFLENGFPTISFGYTNFISPFFKKMDDINFDLVNLKKGSRNGINNGLSVLVDAETFDYGSQFVNEVTRSGVGFKVGVLHHLDIPSIESIGTRVNVGMP